MSSKLVAYFSASSVTAEVAANLAEAIGADLFEIEPKIRYTQADLDWMDKKSRSTLEMSDPASRPEIAVRRDNMKNYDTVFVGFPIWWYVAPTVINTFLESYDLTGKTIARGLVDQQQVDVGSVQTGKSLVHRVRLLIEAGSQLRFEENLLALQAGLLHSAADRLFIHIGVGGVDQAIAILQGADAGSFCLVRGE